MGSRDMMRRIPPRLITAASVAYFALLGLVARVSIALLFKHVTFGITSTRPEDAKDSCRHSSSGDGFFVQNILGCILMAAIARHKKAMNEHLAVGLASGLCGSLTTFATWMGEEAITMRNGYVFESFVSLVCMLCVSLCSYRIGHFMAGCGMGDEPACFDDLCGLRACTDICCRRRRQKRSYGRDSSSESDSEDDSAAEVEAAGPSGGRGARGAELAGEAGEEGEGDAVDEEDWGLSIDTAKSWMEPEPPKDIHLHRGMEVFIVLLALALVLLYVALCASFGYYAGLFDLALAPFGALLRWYLSLFNASASQACYGIPVFTLIANTLGCLFNASPALILTDGVGKLALGAVSTGFAGCLSTVSTLVGELRSDALGGLRVRISYFLISFGLAMAIELPIRGAC